MALTREEFLASVRREIRGHRCRGAALRDRLLQRSGMHYSAEEWLDGERYDALDELAADLFLRDPLPDHSAALAAEMVPYQRTPTRVVLALASHLPPAPGGVFYDLGGGAGEVAILVHLLTGLTAKAVEIEPAFCDYGRRLAAQLDARVEMINADARDVDFSDGTAFFMFTPFTGAVLAKVIDRLHDVAKQRSVVIATLGPCTLAARNESWLKLLIDGQADAKHLALFAS